MSLRLSVRMEQLGCHLTDFHEIWYLKMFQKSVGKSRVSSKSDKNNGYFREEQYTFFIISLSFLLKMKKKIFQTKFIEEMETLILCSTIFF